jgi:hypothetical protein
MTNGTGLFLKCSICSSALDARTNLPGQPVNCPCCGIYRLTPTAAQVLANNPLDEYRATAIAYMLRRAANCDIVSEVDSKFVKRNRLDAVLPRTDEIINEAVLWIGSETRYPGQTLELTYPEYRAVLGAINEDAFNEILTTLLATGWFHGQLTSFMMDKASHIEKCKLTPAGWRRFDELISASVQSRHAFMAMKYADDQLDAIVRDHFAPAVARTGFELRRLDQGQPAGLIDDQLRVQNRTSRFLVCDLTHGNRGAYWEAGFAEGLGRPVIYTCREDVFRDSANANHPHFDTNHFVTVLWNPQTADTAAQRLVDTIRATLPLEAVMEDAAVPISI